MTVSIANSAGAQESLRFGRREALKANQLPYPPLPSSAQDDPLLVPKFVGGLAGASLLTYGMEKVLTGLHVPSLIGGLIQLSIFFQAYPGCETLTEDVMEWWNKGKATPTTPSPEHQ